MRRVSKWNAAKRNACLGEFRRLLGSHRVEEVRNAMKAGRSLKQLMADARVVLVGIDDVQLERFRRRYAVPQSLKGVMFAVATGKQLEPERVVVKTKREVVWSDAMQAEAAVELPKNWGMEAYLVTKERKQKAAIAARKVAA